MNNDGLTLNQLAELNAVLVSEVEKLRAERDQLAAENVGLKKFIQTDCFVGHIEPETFYEEEVTRYVSADGYEPETPATDRIVAGIKADGVPANIAEIIDSGDLETICYESDRSYAEDFRLAFYNFRQLREGADK
ncbi:TPA: hypothetical protein QHR34_003067 [Raoultella ornithinolytica]|nr:hypothetical protein [Raoultella ornithinolytica]HDT1248916.1 hypothetical protein [Raoultella ornithinolytica]